MIILPIDCQMLTGNDLLHILILPCKPASPNPDLE